MMKKLIIDDGSFRDPDAVDIFPNYNLENFKNFLSKNTKITSEKIVSKSGRTLFSFEKE